MYTAGDECQENFKRIPLNYGFCDEADIGPLLGKDSVCIPDDDACPKDFGAFVAAIADALETDEGDPADIANFSEAAETYTLTKCVYPQCFPTAEKKFTFTTTYVLRKNSLLVLTLA